MHMDVGMLEHSFGLVAPRADEFADRFYQRLFRAAPETRALFARADMARQKRVLLSTLAVLVKSLRNLDAMIPVLQFLGQRHSAYGVRPKHYAAVGDALLTTMAETAGDAWRPEYTAAWAGAYDAVRQAMLTGVEHTFAQPVASLDRSRGVATSESQEAVALEIHGRCRTIAHRAADQIGQVAALRAQVRASMEDIAQEHGLSAASRRSTGDSVPAPKQVTPLTLDDVLAQLGAHHTSVSRQTTVGAPRYPGAAPR